MILKGSQRAGCMQLARHLMNDVDNDHITVHELSGFISDTLSGALKEVHAISEGTRCKQFLFSLSLNPPLTEDVPVEDFEAAINAVELKLGLKGQPRAIVFHEKEGRRHAHCVWSRIDIETMTAINLPYFKTKLQDISRELFIQYQWEMPTGFENHQSRDPLNYSNAECQQAKRVKRDPKELKRLFQNCWSASDNQTSFAAALREKGFILAKGDRRGHVAVDKNGEVYAISRWVGIKAKDVRAKLGGPSGLPSVDEVLALLSGQLSGGLIDQSDSIEQSYQEQLSKLITKRDDLVTKQRQARQELTNKHEKRRVQETLERQSKLPTGLTALWQGLSGGYRKIKHTNVLAFQQGQQRDRLEHQALIQQQLRERRRLQAEIEQLEFDHLISIKTLDREIGRHLRIDPAQPLILPDDRPPNLKTRIQKDPAHVLPIITERKGTFTRQDIICELDRYIDQPTALNTAITQVMESSALVKIRNKPTPTFSTWEFIQTKTALAQQAKQMAKTGGQGVPQRHINTAIQVQSKQLQSKVGTNLSDEQSRAIRHILDEKQLSIVVGLAGAGKSTMLAAAHEAWQIQGRRVIGAALAGKAADELQSASNIESRTLASWALSWKNGYNKLQKNDVLVIDEAGMIGSKQLLEFVKAAKEAEAKLVLVGDPEQLQPINAGTPLKDMVSQIETAELTEIRRQKVDWQRQASLDLAQDRTQDAIDKYDIHDAVHHAQDNAAAVARLVNDYLKDANENGKSASRLALAHRRIDVHTINQSIRTARQQKGELLNEQLFNTIYGPRKFAAGDRIVFTRNHKELGLKNGTLGTIEHTSQNRLTVRLDAGGGHPERILSFKPSQYPFIDHGYATTIHKSQGATVDRTFVLGSRRMDRHLTYVALTRHQQDTNLYLDQQSMPKCIQHEPQADFDLQDFNRKNQYTYSMN